MKIKVLEITPPRKTSALGGAKVELTTEDGLSITIDDLRILKNREGVTWCAPPTYAVSEGRNWRYFPTVSFSRELRRLVEDAVLSAFEAQQAGGQ